MLSFGEFSYQCHGDFRRACTIFFVSIFPSFFGKVFFPPCNMRNCPEQCRGKKICLTAALKERKLQKKMIATLCDLVQVFSLARKKISFFLLGKFLRPEYPEQFLLLFLIPDSPNSISITFFYRVWEKRKKTLFIQKMLFQGTSPVKKSVM